MVRASQTFRQALQAESDTAASENDSLSHKAGNSLVGRVAGWEVWAISCTEEAGACGAEALLA